MCFHLIEFWTCFTIFFHFQGKHGALSDLADLLVQNNLYDMAFTILLRFFKGSGLKRFTPLCNLRACVSLFVYMYWYAYISDLVFFFRELERVLSEMAIKCCLDKVESTWVEYVRHISYLYLLNSLYCILLKLDTWFIVAYQSFLWFTFCSCYCSFIYLVYWYFR